MMSRLFIFLLIIAGLCKDAYAQDTVMYLSKDEVLSIVRKYHPVISQATIRVDRMEAEVLASRGAFDPQVTANGEQKTFSGQQYYSYLNPEIKIPTWYGINLKAGAEEIYGDRVNPERSLGKTSYAGVEVSVLNGLIFDERRATLRAAQAYVQMSEQERRLLENDVLLQTIEHYWTWVKAYNKYQLYNKVVTINKERFEFVKQEFRLGNRAAIDTTETLTQLQTYQLMENEAWVEFQNAGWELSTYLWMENNSPVQWSDKILPDSTGLDTRLSSDVIPPLQDLVSLANAEHPKLGIYTYKLDVLNIERRLKQQEFLPKLDLRANLLNKGYDVPANITAPFLENNYKAGFEFKVPLLYRKAIGSYRAARIKIVETELEQDYATLEIENKVKVYYTEVYNLFRQIEIYQAAYNNFNRMYQAELTRYEIGESNLFLINSRENKLLEANLKLIDLKVKWHIKYGTLLWSTGVM